MEAAGGFEPPNRGFADRSLNHLGMPPLAKHIRARISGLGPPEDLTHWTQPGDFANH